MVVMHAVEFALIRHGVGRFGRGAGQHHIHFVLEDQFAGDIGGPVRVRLRIFGDDFDGVLFSADG